MLWDCAPDLPSQEDGGLSPVLPECLASSSSSSSSLSPSAGWGSWEMSPAEEGSQQPGERALRSAKEPLEVLTV